MKYVKALTVPAMVLGLTALTVAPAQAHTPVISADCDGVRIAATAYDAGAANKWSVTIDGVAQSGTFGSSFDQTFPVPQDGATTTWSAVVEGYDGSYRGEKSGTVGPCGTPPPVDVCVDLDGDQPDGTVCTPPPVAERTDEQRLEGCEVRFQDEEYGAGTLTYDETYTDTHEFNQATNTWDLVVDTTATIENLEFTPWSHQEQVENGCVETPNQPPALQTETSSTRLDCEDDVRVTESVVTTTPFVLDEATNTWVPGQPVSETTTEETPVTAGDCDVEVLGVQAAVLPQPQAQALPQPAASQRVPTVVSAGLAPAATSTVLTTAGPAAGVTAGGLPGGALALLAGAGLLLAAGTVRRRSA